MSVSKGKLKAKMPEHFREVERTGEPLIVTDHGREVLEVRPVRKTSIRWRCCWAEYRGGPGKGLAGGLAGISEAEIIAATALELGVPVVPADKKETED